MHPRGPGGQQVDRGLHSEDLQGPGEPGGGAAVEDQVCNFAGPGIGTQLQA